MIFFLRIHMSKLFSSFYDWLSKSLTLSLIFCNSHNFRIFFSPTDRTQTLVWINQLIRRHSQLFTSLQNLNLNPIIHIHSLLKTKNWNVWNVDFRLMTWQFEPIRVLVSPSIMSLVKHPIKWPIKFTEICFDLTAPALRIHSDSDTPQSDSSKTNKRYRKKEHLSKLSTFKAWRYKEFNAKKWYVIVKRTFVKFLIFQPSRSQKISVFFLIHSWQTHCRS